GDTVDENESEQLRLHVFNPVGVDVAFPGGDETFANGTIYDDDATLPDTPIASVNEPSVVEGDAGTTTLRFTLSLDLVLADAPSAALEPEDFFFTRTAGEDYDAIDPTTIPSAACAPCPYTTLFRSGDTVDENESEQLRLHVFNPVGVDVAFPGGDETF